jgi:hypothetical protein
MCNVECESLSLSNAGGDNGLFRNVRVTTNIVSVEGNNHQFLGCQFLAGVQIGTVAAASDNGFSGCQFGPDTSDSTTTLTINSNSNRTRAVGCRSCAAIVDSGTGSELGGNTVY